jgi:hypothetical protein
MHSFSARSSGISGHCGYGIAEDISHETLIQAYRFIRAFDATRRVEHGSYEAPEVALAGQRV